MGALLSIPTWADPRTMGVEWQVSIRIGGYADDRGVAGIFPVELAGTGSVTIPQTSIIILGGQGTGFLQVKKSFEFLDSSSQIPAPNPFSASITGPAPDCFLSLTDCLIPFEFGVPLTIGGTWTGAWDTGLIDHANDVVIRNGRNTVYISEAAFLVASITGVLDFNRSAVEGAFIVDRTPESGTILLIVAGLVGTLVFKAKFAGRV
jgi:hypothetical protein